MRMKMNYIVRLIVILSAFILFSAFTKRENYFSSSEFDCADFYIRKFPEPHDKDILEIIKEKYLVPPPKNPRFGAFDIHAPEWKGFFFWEKIQEALFGIFKDKPPGIFVDIGALDGEYLSQTINLEKNLNWTGLLIEANPNSFKRLATSGRNAWLSPICVFLGNPAVRKFWLPRIKDNMTLDHIHRLLIQSRLASETSVVDESNGYSVFVPSSPLSTVLHALGMKTIDVLSSTTAEDNYEKVRDAVHSKSFDVKSLLLYYTPWVLVNNTVPRIKGYIPDIVRSQLTMMLYHKKSHCNFLNSTECERFDKFKNFTACHTYLCFGHLPVKTTYLL